RLLTKDHPKDFSRGKSISITVGEPMHPTAADAVAENAALHAQMTALLDDAIARYPVGERPPGAWWVPARHGGSAPSLEEAARMDQEEKRARARRKAEKAKRARAGGKA